MKSILLIGAGLFGKHVAMNLQRLKDQVMVIDKDEQSINELLPYVTDAKIGDATNEEFLKLLDIPSFDVCIVAIGDSFENSLQITSLLKELGGKIVVSRASSDVHEKFLLRNGADRVVFPEKQLAKWTAICYDSEAVFDYIELDEEHFIYEIAVPRMWVDKTIKELDIRNKYGINILAVKSRGKLNDMAGPDTRLHDRDTMYILGSLKAIHKTFKL